MNDRANILARLRRWKGGAARYVVASFAAAYLGAGVAPCAMAAPRATDETSIVAYENHAAQEPRHSAAHEQHGHEAHAADAAADHDGPAPVDHSKENCPHCPSSAHGDHAACGALEDLTNVAASHVKDAAKPLVPLLMAAPLMLPPALVSPWPPPPLRAVRGASVPLNVRHCVFLI
jgi:hypothetical protein